MRVVAFLAFLAILALPAAALNSFVTTTVYVSDPPHINNAVLGMDLNCSWYTADMDTGDRLTATVTWLRDGTPQSQLAVRTECQPNAACSVRAAAEPGMSRWSCLIEITDSYGNKNSASASMPSGITGFFLAGTGGLRKWLCGLFRLC